MTRIRIEDLSPELSDGEMGAVSGGLVGTGGFVGLQGTGGFVGITGTGGAIGLTGTAGTNGLTGTAGTNGITGTGGRIGFGSIADDTSGLDLHGF